MLVGARKIDLDLKLEGYNDRSEYEYRRLREVFEKRGGNDPDVSTGLEPSDAGRTPASLSPDATASAVGSSATGAAGTGPGTGQ